MRRTPSDQYLRRASLTYTGHGRAYCAELQAKTTETPSIDSTLPMSHITPILPAGTRLAWFLPHNRPTAVGDVSSSTSEPESPSSQKMESPAISVCSISQVFEPPGVARTVRLRATMRPAVGPVTNPRLCARVSPGTGTEVAVTAGTSGASPGP